MDFYCHTVTSMPENLAKSTGTRMPQMAKLCSPFARAKLHNMLEILLLFSWVKVAKDECQHKYLLLLPNKSNGFFTSK